MKIKFHYTLFLSTTFLCASAVLADDLASALLSRSDASVLGYLRIAQPKEFLKKLDAVTMKTGSRVSDMLPMIAQRYLKNPLLAGVDMDRPWTFVFLDPKRYPNNLAIVLGVSDAAQFCDSFGKGGVSRVQADPASAKNAVRHFTEAEDRFDQKGYIAALRAGEQPDASKFKKQFTNHYFVTVRDKQGCIVGDASLLDQLKPGGSLIGGGTVHGDVAAGLLAPTALALYGSDIQQQKQAMLAVMQTAAGRGASKANPDAATRQGKIIAAMFDALLEMAKQVRWLEIAGELKGGTLKLQFGQQPLPDTLLAKALASAAPAEPDPALLALMPAEVAMIGTMHLPRTVEWNEMTTRMMIPIMQATSGDAKDSDAKWQEMLRTLMDLGMSDVTWAVPATPSGATGFEIVEAIRVKDAVQGRKAQRQAAEMGMQMLAGSMLGGSAGKMKYEQNVAKHNGIEIDRMTMDLGALVQTEAERAQMKGLFGSSFTWQVAFSGQLELIAAGLNSDANIRGLLDLANKPSAKPPARPRVDAALASFPKKNNGVFLMGLGEYFRMVRNTLPSGDAAMFQQLEAMLAENQVDIAGYFQLRPQAAMMEVCVPLDRLMDAANKLKAVQKPAAPAAQ